MAGRPVYGFHLSPAEFERILSIPVGISGLRPPGGSDTIEISVSKRSRRHGVKWRFEAQVKPQEHSSSVYVGNGRPIPARCVGGCSVSPERNVKSTADSKP